MPIEPTPNVFLVGAQKSGTSALAGWLAQHSQVYMSFPKEPGFLAFGKLGYPYLDGYGKKAPASKYVVNDEGDYRKLFAAATSQHRAIGEASTWYLATPGTAATIKERNPDAKIIVILRNPVERAYSAWCHARSDMIEPCDNFADALAMENQRGEVEFLLRYKQMGLYSDSLAQYQSIFPESQLLILFHDDLRTDPQTVWQTLGQFLGIDTTETPDFEGRYNTSGEPRSRFLQKILHSHRLKRTVRRLLPHATALRLKANVDSINLQVLPTMSDSTRSKLQDFYRSDIAAVSELTGRDLSAWLR